MSALTPTAAAAASKLRVPCNPALLALAGARRVLLLQGPLGPFFDRLTHWLHRRGAHVERVAFQGGDELDTQAIKPVCFTGKPSDWVDFIRSLLKSGNFDHVVLFGQARFYHSVAVREARTLGVQVVVMEEGYFRPGFATMELDGVNGYSNTLDRFEWVDGADSPVNPLPVSGPLQPHDCERHFRNMAWFASQHYLAIRKHVQRFPHYLHHKEANPYWYARYWVWSWLKKYWFRPGDMRLQREFISSGRSYFLVALQNDGDSQITHHSTFRVNTNFIIQVMRSFSTFAPADAKLVFRQHPFARGGAGHAELIQALSKELGLDERVVHLVEGDTPVLAQHSQGVVLINSTVGLQAIERGAPVIALGQALYHQEGLTFQHGLDRFWTEGQPASLQAQMAFVPQLKNLTQVPASLYALRDAALTWR